MRMVPTAIVPLEQRRFEALAGYTRHPIIIEVTQEFAWRATADERILGLASWDRADYDFGWVILARDERFRYRAIDVNASLPSADAALAELEARMLTHAARPDTDFHQGDASGGPVDFFTPVVADERLHPSFRMLACDPRYSPARELIAAMMRYHEDADGNFIEQFQTTGFDARLWELYLFALFTELGYARDDQFAVPDFMLASVFGPLGVEATTVNPPDGREAALPTEKKALLDYIENYIPIKLARALKRKLNKRTPYWSLPHMADVPFVLAIQDFHAPGSMQPIVSAAVEYVFGVRHSMVAGKRQIERIDEHRYGGLVEKSGFFFMPGAENVSAVLINPQGTITKFNRIGYIAGFGDRRVRMTRIGYRRTDADKSGPAPQVIADKVHEPGYSETWVEGAVVLHNPRARIALDPSQIIGAAHEFLQPDGSIMTLLPDFQPLFTGTDIRLEADEE